MSDERKTRREILKVGGGLLVTGALMPSWINSFAQIQKTGSGKKYSKEQNILVLVELAGGNDGLNTVIPYADDIYYKSRPNLAIKQNDVQKLTPVVGLHPSLAKFRNIYDEGNLAVIQSVGYPNFDRSHFRAAEIYQSAKLEGLPRAGWVGKKIDLAYKEEMPPCACRFGNQTPIAFMTERAPTLSLDGIEALSFQTNDRKREDRDPWLKAFKDIYSAPRTGNPYAIKLQKSAGDAWALSEKLKETAKNYKAEDYPNNGFAQGLRLIAQMIQGEFGMSVYYIALGGFDTHANQRQQHANLLTQVGDSLFSFYRDLQKHDQSQRVVVMTFSEFGRRVQENGSQGTDHGTAIPMFMIGEKVKGGIYGANPDLKNLQDGDPSYNIDFRSVYSTVLKNWWGSDAEAILGGKFETLPILETNS